MYNLFYEMVGVLNNIIYRYDRLSKRRGYALVVLDCLSMHFDVCLCNE